MLGLQFLELLTLGGDDLLQGLLEVLLGRGVTLGDRTELYRC